MVTIDLKVDHSSTINQTIVLNIFDRRPGMPPVFEEKVFQRFSDSTKVGQHRATD